MLWKNVNEKYSGEWVNDLPDGNGVQIWYDQKNETSCLINRYVGEWKKGSRDGYGIYFYSNGAKYEGTWKNNFKEGFGIFTFSDGKKYIGLFNKDNMVDAENPITLDSINKYLITKLTKKKSTINKKKNLNEKVSSVKKKAPNLVKINPIVNKKSFRGNQNLESSNDLQHMKNTLTITNNMNTLTSNANITSAINNVTNVTKEEHKSKEKLTKKKENINKSLNRFIPFLEFDDLYKINKNITKNLKEIQNLFLRNLSGIKRCYVNSTKLESENDDQKEKSEIVLQSNNVNNMMLTNGLSYCMKLKELWRFLRSIGINSYDFSLADFDRFYFNEDVNKFSMFYIPLELNQIHSYDYMNNLIYDSKINFAYLNNRYLQYYHLKVNENNENISYLFDLIDNNNSINIDNIQKNKDSTNSNSNNYIKNYNKIKINNTEIPELLSPKAEKNNTLNFNIHDKNQVILLRHFYSAIIRISLLKFLNEVDTEFEDKLKRIFSMCKLTIPSFKKGGLGGTRTSISRLETSSMQKENKALWEHTKLMNNEYILIDNFAKDYEQKLKPLFINLYIKSHNGAIFNFNDMTLTYYYFYKNVIKKSKLFIELYENKESFIELINHFDREKPSFVNEKNITDNNLKMDKIEYIEFLLNREFIFYEFVEMVYYIYKKYISFKQLNDENHNIKVLINHLYKIIKIESYHKASNKINRLHDYYFPKLTKHEKKEFLILSIQRQNEKLKAEQLEKDRYITERKNMDRENENAYVGDENQPEEDEDEESDN